MAKRLVVLLLAAGSLSAFEDVSFSARSLGLGGEHSAVAEDAFSMITNPALPARYKRSVVSICAAPYIHRRFYWTAGYAQPVPGLGVIGASLLYYDRLGMADIDIPGEADVRFFAPSPWGVTSAWVPRWAITAGGTLIIIMTPLKTGSSRVLFFLWEPGLPIQMV